MAEEKTALQTLIELGVLTPTDEPINVMLTPQTDPNAKFTHEPEDDLEAFYYRSANDPFWATLGHAIQAYARLEQSLCGVFQDVTGMTPEIAGIVFYKITSSNVRDGILEQLAKKKYGERHAPFWHSLLKFLHQVSQDRNSIVHWRAGIHPTVKEIQLTLPRLQRLEDIEKTGNYFFNTAKLNEFIAKCEFIEDRIGKFLMIQKEFWQKHMNPETLKAWQDICQQPIVYPVPSPAPSSPTDGAPAIQPPPSPA